MCDEGPAVDSTVGVDDMLRIKRETDRQEVVYRLGGIDPDEGIDIYEIVPLLEQFRDLVTETAVKMGCQGEVDIRVRPFKEGSFITEFIVQEQKTLVGLFASDGASALANALALLGFLGVGSVATIPRIVKAVKGRVDKFKKNDDGTYTYGTGDDAVTVSAREHDALQSPKIADLYGKVAVGPIVKFDGAVQQVNIYVRDKEADDGGISQGSVFTRENAAPFAEYSKSAELIDKLESQECVSTAHGLVLTPLSGPYDGAERGYTFSDGASGSKYSKVAIEDESFRAKLESTEVRLAKGDCLKVDLQIKQSRTKSGNIATRYTITRVLEYVPREIPVQSQLDFSETE